jgi:RNA polymerase sigma-70 factor (ECF subfamily)
VAESDRRRLREQIVEGYDGLIRQLTRRLGSLDFAYEALHDTFVQLERVPDGTQVRKPADYIFRTAINIAKNRRKAQNYRVSAAEIDALLDVRDETPDPARIAEARSDVEAFKKALAELPERPREVLRQMAIEGRTAQDVAEQLKVSVRTVEADLAQALKHCAGSLGRPLYRRLGGPRPRM